MFEDQCCDQAMPEQVGGGVVKTASPREPGVLQLTEEGIMSLQQLKESLSKLEEVVRPVCTRNEESMGQTAEKMPEPDMSRPDVRVRIMNEEIRKANLRVQRLLRVVNI